MISNHKIKFGLRVLLIAVLLILAFQILLPVVTSESFKSVVRDSGPLAPLIVITYTVVSHVIAPVSGSPGIVLSMAVFGLIKTVIYLYIASLISATINFWLSRRYGRSLVLKLVGKDVMKEVDEFSQHEGKKMFWVARLFGFTIFEVISYAYGLTKITFKEYMIITILGSIPSSLIMWVVFRRVDFESPTGLYIWLSSLILTGAVFTYLVKRYLSNRPKFPYEKQ